MEIPRWICFKEQIFLENGTINLAYTTFISHAIYDKIPESILKEKDFEKRNIINSDSPEFKEIIRKEIFRLNDLIENHNVRIFSDYNLPFDCEKLENILKEIEN